MVEKTTTDRQRESRNPVVPKPLRPGRAPDAYRTRPVAMTHAVRECDLPFLGPPQPVWKIPDETLALLAGRRICCPGCHEQNFCQDPQFAAFVSQCHTNGILNEFRRRFPDADPPKQLSLGTKDPGELRRVLVDEDAIFCGVSPPRGAPSVPGVKLQRTIFGNPQKLADRVAAAEHRVGVAQRGIKKGNMPAARLEKALKSVERAKTAVARADAFEVQPIGQSQTAPS